MAAKLTRTDKLFFTTLTKDPNKTLHWFKQVVALLGRLKTAYPDAMAEFIGEYGFLNCHALLTKRLILTNEHRPLQPGAKWWRQRIRVKEEVWVLSDPYKSPIRCRIHIVPRHGNYVIVWLKDRQEFFPWFFVFRYESWAKQCVLPRLKKEEDQVSV